MGVGMGNVMAPATESIMGSLPREKAGVGSAMNDTTRQVGGAIGVAVLGSLLSSHYRPSVSSALVGQSARSRSSPRPRTPSVGAVGVANDPLHPIAAGFRTQIIDAAHQSFIGGLHLASVVAAVDRPDRRRRRVDLAAGAVCAPTNMRTEIDEPGACRPRRDDDCSNRHDRRRD